MFSLRSNFGVAAALMMSVLATGCGGIGSPASESDSLSAMAAFCQSDLQSKFEDSYAKIINDPALCIQCHSDAGISPYKFGSADRSKAFQTFMQVGADTFDGHAVDSNHAPGVTGPALQTRVTAARAIWNPALQSYQSCLNGSVNGALVMIDKNEPNLYFGDGRKVTMNWDLSGNEAAPAGARFPGIFSVDVNVDYNVDSNGVNVATGYSFTNPRVQVLTGEKEIEVQGLTVKINGTVPKGIENFLSADKVAKGIDPANLFSGTVSVTLDQVSTGDKISFGFVAFSLRNRTDNPPVPPAPTVSARNPFTSQTTVPLNVGGDSTARRWCLTASPNRPSSTAVPCPGFENNLLTNGWLTARPGNFDLATLGRPVTSGETITFYLWVANSDLKISASAGVGSVTFDSTAPAAAVLGSVSVTDTQIADLVGLGGSNETVNWCVIEGATMMSVQNAGSCNFSSTKPTYVGLAGGGTRYVAVFVRDLAGNTTASPVKTVDNPWGRITYTTLADSAQGNRAVFANRCVSCHGAGGANQANWDETSYADTVAKKSKILGRIDNAASPMPPAGLAAEKDRALIRLWFSQTSTPVQ